MEIKIEYIVALIGAGGTVLAAILGALIAGGYISKMFNRNVLPLFRTYSDERHDAHKLMRRAKESIYFVVSIGDELLKKYEKQMKSYLKRGIELKFLIHEEAKYFELESFINGSLEIDKDGPMDARNETMEKIRILKKDYPGLIEIVEFPLFFSASYIGVDIDAEKSPATNEWPSSSLIQVMLYQYRVPAKDSPITYFTPKANRELFESTAESIIAMWDNAVEREREKNKG